MVGGQEEGKQARFLRKECAHDELADVVLHIQEACKPISALLASPTALPLSPAEEGSTRAGSGSGARDIPKPLDIVSAEQHFKRSFAGLLESRGTGFRRG